MTAVPIDLGLGHTITTVGRHGLPEVVWGAIVGHPDARNPSGECVGGYITFDGPAQREQVPGRPMWAVEAWDPMTLSPSLLCTQCGDHGFVRDGRWVPA